MKKIVALMLLTIVVVFATKWAPAPNIPAEPIIGNYDPSLKPLPPTGTDQNLIYQVPDLRATAGSPGKNVAFAEDGQNVAVLYNRYSGDPTNMMQLYTAYSSDRGANWVHYGPLSTFNARRTYPGLDAEENWPDPADLRIHFAWHQAAQVSGAYDSSPCYYSKEVMYPDGLITAAFRMPNSGTWDLWQPAIAVKDSIVVCIAANNETFLTTDDAYIWRSTDYGETWDDGRIFFPGPLLWMSGPHFRYGSGGYMFFLWNRALESNPSLFWPYYCESFDYGVTWTDPQLIWQNTPPYPDMSNVTGWWYTYDCEVVNDTPVAAMKLGTGTYDFGEVWVYRPTGGTQGNWQFTGKKLVYGDSTAPQTIARYATLAKDDQGDVFLGYQANFITGNDTGFDCGVFVRPAHRDTWEDRGLVTFGHYAAATDQAQLEFAHNAPIVGTSPNDSAVIGLIWTNAQTYPTTGNLYFEHASIPLGVGIVESNYPEMPKANIVATPNPFRNSVKFVLGPNSGPSQVSIYDATGRLIRELNSELVWDGRNSDGQLVKPGIYFYNLVAKTENAKGKIIVSR